MSKEVIDRAEKLLREIFKDLNDAVSGIPETKPVDPLLITLYEKEISRLNKRIDELLECNTAYLLRARAAEEKLPKSLEIYHEDTKN